MNKIQTLLTTTVLLFGISGSGVADFNDGYNAYEKGDYKTAFNEWKPLAEEGGESAQYNIGWLYDNGKGVLKDYKEAVKWYRKAAEQGLASAQGNLGAMYANGHGVLKDLSKAKYWIKKAYDNPDAKTRVVENAEKNWNRLELWKY